MNTLFLIAILGFQVLQDASCGSIAKSVEGADVDSSDVSIRQKRGATGCQKAHHLKPGGPTVSLQKAANDECHWTLIGDVGCNPALHCNDIKLKKDDDCSDEYIKVSDGIGNELKVCGHLNFDKPLIAGPGGRDLFVKVSADQAISCSASCSTGQGIELPPADVKRKEDFQCVCGLQNKDDRIVGGEDAKSNEFPWQVAIVYSGTRSPKCGGTVINNQFILTASHCFWFEKTKPSEIEVLSHAYILDMTKKDIAVDVALGEYGSIRGSGYNKKAYTDAEEGTQRFRVAEIIMHPMFTENYDYDFALLRLDRKIDLTAPDAPTPICLPPPNNWNKLFEGTSPTVVGWGMPDENAGGTTRVLQKLNVPIIPLGTCSAWLPGTVTQRMICAGFEEGKKDACTGDSGGPLIMKQPNKQWWQIGIVSWGEGCAQRHKPGLYSRVTEMLPWIRYHANGNDAKWCRDTK